ncbi:MAG: tripartite tricarboxylate transporter substrate binding protein [Proteobacteria bacterium]|nr:tripartite tricarboxylate transporter substrate binding protein [Pseudomonadota bacterium]
MKTRRDVLVLGAALPWLMAGNAAEAGPGGFPSRVVRIVVPFTPGGSADLSARILAEKLSTIWGQPVIIENRPGAGTTIASSYVAHAEPTGYILYLAYNTSYAATATMYQKLPYDPLKDLAPVSLVASAPFILTVGPKSPAKTFDEFLALVKDPKQDITFASTGTGAGPHLATELFLREAGLKARHIPYRGSGEVITALLGGFVQFSFLDVSALGALQSGQLRALAVTSPQRWAQLPKVPTIAESMHSNFQISSDSCILAPATTPRDIVFFVNASIVNALAMPDVIKRYSDQGFIAVSSTPDALSAKIRTDIDRLGKVIKDLGLTTG